MSPEFIKVLDVLHNAECMLRIVYPNTPRLNLSFYLLNTPCLIERRTNALRQMERLRVVDTTVVHCANRNDVTTLSNEAQSILHPGLVRTSGRVPANALDLAR